MGVNKAILVGNVGTTPDAVNFDKSQKTSFPLATTERGYTLPNGTQIPDRTEWHNIVCWGGLAKIAAEFIHKGSRIYVEGKITSREYTDKNQIKRYITEIIADTIELLDSKKESM